MKRIGFALLAAMSVACSGGLSPSPPVSITAPTPASSDISPSVEQKISLFIYSDDDPYGGNVHLVGLPVTIEGEPSGTVIKDLTTDRQGRVRFALPATDTSAVVTIEDWKSYCGTTVTISVQLLKSGDGFILLHKDCGE